MEGQQDPKAIQVEAMLSSVAMKLRFKLDPKGEQGGGGLKRWLCQ
jgi:hypothetical protein